MKKVIATGLIILSIISVSACKNIEVIQVNTDSESITSATFGKEALRKIGNYLWYDSTTNIVYWWGGYLNMSDYDTVPSPYYAPNGLPYRYNPTTNTLEEIPDFYS